MDLVDRVLLLNLPAVGNFSLLVGHIGVAAGWHRDECEGAVL